jgi:hypothetical protein
MFLAWQPGQRAGNVRALAQGWQLRERLSDSTTLRHDMSVDYCGGGGLQKKSCRMEARL